MADSPATLDRFVSVSRETRDRLAAYVDLLHRWQRIKNLVGPSTLDEVWSRHIADSLQLARCAPLDAHWADLGSGAGFPGLVIAIAMGDKDLAPDGPGHVHLIESNQRKAAFLREVARVVGAPVTIHAARIEAVLPQLSGIGVVTARALAPLTDLLGYAQPFVEKGGIALFPKGQDVDSELTQATRFWSIDVETIPSQTDPAGVILRITRITPSVGSAP